MVRRNFLAKDVMWFAKNTAKDVMWFAKKTAKDVTWFAKNTAEDVMWFESEPYDMSRELAKGGTPLRKRVGGPSQNPKKELYCRNDHI